MTNVTWILTQGANYYSVEGYEFCVREEWLSLEFDAVCDEKCHQECATSTYESIISSYDQKGSLQSISVDYLDVSFIEISQTPQMNGYSLMNEIGGALALFIGITFLSLIELVEWAYEIVFLFFKWNWGQIKVMSWKNEKANFLRLFSNTYTGVWIRKSFT